MDEGTRSVPPDKPGTQSRTTVSGAHKARITLWVLIFLAPIVLFIITQLDSVQNADGWFIRNLTSWDLGRKEIVADILAPLWVISIVVFAALGRRIVGHYAPAREHDKRTPAERAVIAATWAATVGAGAILVMSWTREWERFNEQPNAFWYVATILVVLGLALAPLWWARHSLFQDAQRVLAASPTMARIDRWLFREEGAHGSRWIVTLTFAALTALVATVILGQLDNLVAGMHTSGGTPVGVTGLTSVFELDLSQKSAQIVERVGDWVAYGADVGSGFASAYAVSTAYLALDTVVLIPSLALAAAILLLHVRRTRPVDLSEQGANSYGLVNGIGLALLVIWIGASLLENVMAWIIIDAAWFDPGSLGSWRPRLMWFASMFRVLSLGGLIAVAILTLAFRASRYRWLGRALIAVRGQILVIVFVALTLGMAQVEDVVRRWTVATAFLTVAMATALAVLVHWTSAQSFHRLVRDRSLTLAHEPITPTRLHLPFRHKTIALRSAVVGAVFALAAFQVLLVGALGVPIGLGFTIPAALIGVVWAFGLPLPDARFVRGDRDISQRVRSWAPRFLGALVYIILGLVVIRSAVSQLVFALHADAWLVFCAVPLILGVYRIWSRTWTSMGGVEFAIIAGTSAFGLSVWAVKGDPELSSVALLYLGLLIFFGAMPFYYSFSRESLPSRILRDWMPGLKIQPLILAGGMVAAVMSLALLIAPVQVGSPMGTVAIVLLGAMLFAGAAAAAVSFAERTKPPKLLSAFRVKRTPVFIFMLMWLTLAGIVSTGPSNEVDVIDRAAEVAGGPVTVEDVWQRWLARNMPTHSTDSGVPMLIIASSGGGIRAAAWTSYVLDCLFGAANRSSGCHEAPIDRKRIAAASGVSGGSLGIASWAAATAMPAPASGDWVKDRLGEDYLAASMAWLLLVDTPRSFIGLDPSIRDRADVMESSWEAAWRDDPEGLLSRGLFDIWHARQDLPLMVFNGTSVNDPCRFSISVLDASGHDLGDSCTSLTHYEGRSRGLRGPTAFAATKDLSDYLCDDQDLKLSTGVLLSARFPVISPSGKLGGALSCVDRHAAAYVVDGGYSEGSGAGTATELWNALEVYVDAFNRESAACVVPFFLQIDNGYEIPIASSVGTTPIEVLVPIRTLIAGQFGRIAHAREQAAMEFDRRFAIAGQLAVVRDESARAVESRYARITTRAHPGIQAPLGWTLSEASFDDLRSQLHTAENQAEFDEIRRWFSGPLHCRVSAES